eukprot:COSAG02_NODE_487_length_21276_cov_36.093167_5_plen_250_part_00
MHALDAPARRAERSRRALQTMTAAVGGPKTASFSDWLGLAYEQKHAVAAQWVASQHTDGSDGDGLLTEDASLALWALGQQLQHGDNAEEKPNFWEVYASAKWSAYESLRGTSRLDAMRKFISILDEDLGPRWPLEHASDLVAAAVAEGDPTELCSATPTLPSSAAAVTQAVAPTDVASQSQGVGAPAVATASAVVSSGAEMWRVLAAGSDGPRPPPRCHHTTTLVGRRLLVMGGSGAHGVNHKLIHGWA